LLVVQGLGVGVDGEEGTSGGDGRDKGTGSAFVPFEMAAAVVVVGLRNGIGDSLDFHDFGGEDILVSRESSVAPTRIPSGVWRPFHIADRVGDGGGIRRISFESGGIRRVGGSWVHRVLDGSISPNAKNFSQGFYSDCARGGWRGCISRQVEPAVDVHGKRAVEGVVGVCRIAEGDHFQHGPVGDARTLETWLHLHSEPAPALVGGNKTQVGWARVVACEQEWLPHVGGVRAGVDGIRDRVAMRGVAGRGGI